jgi:DNA-binding NarL/FixJ family response regulator
MIKFAITDDNIAFIEHIKQELSIYTDLEFCFMASTGKECLKILTMIQKDKLPDVILMDIEMPELDGIETTQYLHSIEAYSNIQIIILTTFSDDDKVLKAIQYGAKGYLLKTESSAKIYNAIQDVYAGNSHLSPAIARKILNIFSQINFTESNLQSSPYKESEYKLTQQEHNILEYVNKGFKYKRIGELLFIEESTVKKHIRNIYAKLGAHNKLEALNKLKSPEGGI